MVRVKREHLGPPVIIKYEHRRYYAIAGEYYVLSGDQPYGGTRKLSKRDKPSKLTSHCVFGYFKAQLRTNKEYPLVVTRVTGNTEGQEGSVEEKVHDGHTERWMVIDHQKGTWDGYKPDMQDDDPVPVVTKIKKRIQSGGLLSSGSRKRRSTNYEEDSEADTEIDERSRNKRVKSPEQASIYGTPPQHAHATSTNNAPITREQSSPRAPVPQFQFVTLQDGQQAIFNTIIGELRPLIGANTFSRPQAMTDVSASSEHESISNRSRQRAERIVPTQRDMPAPQGTQSRSYIEMLDQPTSFLAGQIPSKESSAALKSATSTSTPHVPRNQPAVAGKSVAVDEKLCDAVIQGIRESEKHQAYQFHAFERLESQIPEMREKITLLRTDEANLKKTIDELQEMVDTSTAAICDLKKAQPLASHVQTAMRLSSILSRSMPDAADQIYEAARQAWTKCADKRPVSYFGRDIDQFVSDVASRFELPPPINVTSSLKPMKKRREIVNLDEFEDSDIASKQLEDDFTIAESDLAELSRIQYTFPLMSPMAYVLVSPDSAGAELAREIQAAFKKNPPAVYHNQDLICKQGDTFVKVTDANGHGKHKYLPLTATKEKHAMFQQFLKHGPTFNALGAFWSPGS